MMLVLAQAAHESAELTPASVVVSTLVMVLALVFAGLAFAAARKRGNRGLRVVALAFVVFAVKNAFSAYNVLAHSLEDASLWSVEHDALELVLSLFDLVLLVLLFVPLFLRRRS